MRGSTPVFLTVALALAGATVAVAPAFAGPSASDRLASAERILRSTPATKFASAATKRQALRLARRARASTRARRRCAALRRVDQLRVLLAKPTTWDGRTPPRLTLRRLQRTLNPAARTLLRRAGPRCAKKAETGRTGSATRADGPYEPLPPAEQGTHVQGAAEERGSSTPPGRYIPVADRGPETAVAPEAARAAGRAGAAAVAPPTIFRTTDLGTPLNQATPNETTTAVGGDIVWLTGNTMVAFSVNGGRSFTYVDPATILPDNGLPICCDQVVTYSSKHRMFVWLSQYHCQFGASSPPSQDCRAAGAGSNRLRIAVASPGEIRANAINPSHAWTFWDLTPADVGEPNAWFDYNELVVNRTRAVLTTDVHDASAADLALVARFPLSQLAARRGTLDFGYFIEKTRHLKPAHGEGHSSTYIAGNETFSRVKIWAWPDGSQLRFPHAVDHASVATDVTQMPTFAADWNMRTTTFGSDFRGQVRSMTMSGGDLWLAWATGRNVCLKRSKATGTCADSRSTFPWPTIQVARIDTKSWRLRDEQFLWSGTHGYAFPALATNREGDVGVGAVMNSNAGTPVPVVGYLTPRLSLKNPLSSDWLTAGDYSSLRPGSTDGSFVFAAFTERPDPSVPPNPANTRGWHYIEYGRGSAPPPEPPRVTIDSPLDGRSFYAGEPITYAATVVDPGWGTLADAAIVWTEDGAAIGTGPRITRSGTPIGTHAIQVTATNPDGLSASARITVRVVAAESHAPTVAITDPLDNSEFPADSGIDPVSGERYRDVQFTAHATDADGDPLTFQWWDSINGGPYAQVAFELSPTLRLYARPPSGSESTTHDLILVASDGTNRATAGIRIRIFTID